MNTAKFTTVDEYIALFSADIQEKLQTIRHEILSIDPAIQETISYQMPAYKLNGNLVYFGAFKDHLSFFPTGSGVEAFQDELSEYQTSKGTIQFPYDKPIPLDLIKRIVKYRIKQNTK